MSRKGLYPKYFVDHTILMYKDVKTKNGKLITRYQTQSPTLTYTSKHFHCLVVFQGGKGREQKIILTDGDLNRFSGYSRISMDKQTNKNTFFYVKG